MRIADRAAVVQHHGRSRRRAGFRDLARRLAVRITGAGQKLTEAPELRILDNTFAFRAVWKPLDQLIDSDIRFVLYPTALRERMAEFLSVAHC